MFGFKKTDRDRLDAAVAAVRDEPLDLAAEAEAAERALAQLRSELADSGERIESCGAVERLLPLRRAGGLAPERALLVDDHLRECVRCRAAFEGRDDRQAAAEPWSQPAARRKAAMPRVRWLAAAAAAAGIALTGWWWWLAAGEAGSQAAVQSVSGSLFAVGGSAPRALGPGQTLSRGEAVRTARGGRAVLTLADGSAVEMDERAQFSVASRGRDTTLQLERGSIIVKAAKRTAGRLYVTTADCRVAVTGTVFSVSHGLAGSRVSVVEGEVRVMHAGQESVLHPGDQVTTSQALGPVPVASHIAWSQEKDHHLAVLAELSALGQKMASISEPALRHDSALLPLVPERTTLYVGIPNYGEAIGEAYALFRERLGESSVLRGWWEKEGPGKGEVEMGDAVAKLQALSDYLGDEIVIAAQPSHSGSGAGGGVVALAEVRKPGLQGFVSGELATLGKGDVSRLRFVDEAALGTIRAGAHELLVLEWDGLVAISSDAAQLRGVAARRASPGGFEARPFGARVRKAYAAGAGILVAADLAAIAGTKDPQAPAYLIAERKGSEGGTEQSATLGFNGPRKGLAAWLGPAAPMGSLEFVSAGSAGAAAVLFKNPAALLEEILEGGGADGARRAAALLEFEAETNVRVREDIVAALGGEVALALDGPILPTPAWKAVIEVNDADRLLGALTTLVDAAAQKTGSAGPRVQLLREQADGQILHTLRLEGAAVPFEAHFAVIDGYLVATPSRALLARAIEIRRSGQSLARSSQLTSLLPADDQGHCSGVIYQNFGTVLGPLAQTLGESGRLSQSANDSIAALAAAARPSVIALYGEDESIRIASRGQLPGFDGALALPALLGSALGGSGTHGTARP
jgi:hypothetical protein